jgi:hypothetical protein
MNLIAKSSFCVVLAMAAAPAYAANWMIPDTIIRAGESTTTDVIFAAEGLFIKEAIIEIQLPSALSGFSFVAHSVGNGTCFAEKFGTNWTLLVASNNLELPLHWWPETYCQLEIHLSPRAATPAHSGFLFQPIVGECYDPDYRMLNCSAFFGYMTVHNAAPGPRS